jgi:hypothetical protein
MFIFIFRWGANRKRRAQNGYCQISHSTTSV